MATGDAFNTALAAKVAPLKIVSIRGNHVGLTYRLSSGKVLSVSRKKVKDATTPQMTTYINALVA